MSGTKSSGGKSSKGFFHWLKNTWPYKKLSKFWNWITSCFRPEQEETEPQSALAKQEKNDGNNNDKSQSLEVEQEGVSKSSIIENDELGSQSNVTLLDNSHVKNRAPKPKTRLPSKEKRHNDALSNSPSNQSKNDDQANAESQDLEWDDSSIFSSTSSQPEAQETSPQPGQKLGSSDTEKGTVFIAFLEAQKLFNDPVANKACIAFLEAVLSYNADKEYIRDHLQKLTDHPQFVEYILDRFLMVSRLIENEIINRGELQSCNTSQLHLQGHELD